MSRSLRLALLAFGLPWTIIPAAAALMWWAAKRFGWLAPVGILFIAGVVMLLALAIDTLLKRRGAA